MDKNKSIFGIIIAVVATAIAGILAINNEKIGDTIKKTGETIKDLHGDSPDSNDEDTFDDEDTTDDTD